MKLFIWETEAQFPGALVIAAETVKQARDMALDRCEAAHEQSDKWRDEYQQALAQLRAEFPSEGKTLTQRDEENARYDAIKREFAEKWSSSRWHEVWPEQIKRANFVQMAYPEKPTIVVMAPGGDE